MEVGMLSELEHPIIQHPHLTNMTNLIKNYDGFMVDLWGVIHDGIQAYPGVVDCINKLIGLDKQILFVSNAPRPGWVAMKKLQELGIPAMPDMILTSGDVVREQLIH